MLRGPSKKLIKDLLACERDGSDYVLWPQEITKILNVLKIQRVKPNK